MRSQADASHRLLKTIGHVQWQSVITPALMYEYEDVARRPGNVPGLNTQDISDVLNLITGSRIGSLFIFRGGRCPLILAMTWFWKQRWPEGATLWYRSMNGISGQHGNSASKS